MGQRTVRSLFIPVTINSTPQQIFGLYQLALSQAPPGCFRGQHSQGPFLTSSLAVVTLFWGKVSKFQCMYMSYMTPAELSASPSFIFLLPIVKTRKGIPPQTHTNPGSLQLQSTFGGPTLTAHSTALLGVETQTAPVGVTEEQQVTKARTKAPGNWIQLTRKVVVLTPRGYFLPAHLENCLLCNYRSWSVAPRICICQDS